MGSHSLLSLFEWAIRGRLSFVLVFVVGVVKEKFMSRFVESEAMALIVRNVVIIRQRLPHFFCELCRKGERQDFMFGVGTEVVTNPLTDYKCFPRASDGINSQMMIKAVNLANFRDNLSLFFCPLRFRGNRRSLGRHRVFASQNLIKLPSSFFCIKIPIPLVSSPLHIVNLFTRFPSAWAGKVRVTISTKLED